MRRDMQKYADWLAENAREGVVIENMILEWKLAERAKQTRGPVVEQPVAKAS